MKKINLELGKISKGMRLRFSLILDQKDMQNKRMSLISQFHIDGNDYIRLNPHPYLTIDISDAFDRNESWSTNHFVNLNQFSKMKFERNLSVIIRNFQIKDLFFYNQENKLRVNPDVNRKLGYHPFVIGNKTVYIQNAVVQDDKNPELEYEGIVFCINTADNFCYLTVDELNYMYYLIKSINLYSFSMQVLTWYQTIEISKQNEILTIPQNVIRPPIIEDEEIVPDPVQVPPIEEPNEIPDLE